METIAQDLAFGARILRRSPAFTALIVCTLALGIGANTAVFSIVEAVLLRSLPYHDPGRLALTFDAPVRDKETKVFMPYRDFTDWESKNHSYAAMAAETWIRGPRFMLSRGAPQSILASLLFGVQPKNPLILSGVSLTLILAALLATYVPAPRATRVNPIDSLRSE